MAFDKDAEGMAMSSFSARVAEYRSGRVDTVEFSNEDRAKQASEKKRR